MAIARGGGGAAAGAPAPAGSKKVSLNWPIFISFLYFLSVAVTTAALPAFCNSLFTANGVDKVNRQGVNLHGLFSSVDQLFTFLFVGMWGSLSDRVGRKPMAAFSAAGVAIGWLTVAFSNSIPFLLAGRAVDGVTSCMLPITQGMVRDISPPTDLETNMGRLQGVSVGSAFIVGAMSGGILTKKMGPRFVFKIAAGVAGLATLIALTVAPETLPAQRVQSPKSQSSGGPIKALRMLGRSRTSIGSAATFLLFWTGLNGLQINLFNFAQHKYGWDKVQSTKLQAMSGVLLAVSNGIGPKVLLPRIGLINTVRLGMFGMAICLQSMAFAASEFIFFASVCGASLCTVCLPVLMGTLAKEYPAEEGGASLAALETANTLNRVAAYRGMAWIFGWCIAEGRAKALSGAFFAVGSVLVGLGAALFEVVVAPQLRRAEKESRAVSAAGGAARA